MLLHADKLLAALKQAKEVIEHTRLYCLSSDRIPVSIVDLEWVIQDITGISISKYQVTTSTNLTYFRGMLDRSSKGKARIFINANQPDYWQRYTCAKELCHILIDKESDFSQDGAQTLNKMIEAKAMERFLDENKIPQEDGMKVPDNEVQSENIAEIIATEIMYPYEFREKDLAQLKAGKVTTASLALHFKVPPLIIQTALGADYLRVIKDMRKQLK